MSFVSPPFHFGVVKNMGNGTVFQKWEVIVGSLV